MPFKHNASRRHHIPKARYRETAIGRDKRLIGARLRSRTLSGQQGEAAIAVAVLNRMIRVAKPVSVRRT